MSEQEKQNRELHEALTEVRNATEEIKKLQDEGKAFSEWKEKAEKAEAKLDALEEKNQKLIKDQAEERKSSEEMAETIKQMEIKMAKLSTANVAGVSEQKQMLASELKSLTDFAKGNIDQVEKKYLRTDSNTEGGFLMTSAYDDMIIKPITEISPIRSVARTKRIDAVAMESAVRSSLVVSAWTGEGQDFSLSNSTYEKPKIPVHSLTTLTDSTNKALLGSNWNLEQEVAADMAESRAQKEGSAFVDGDGVAKPTGFLSSSIQVPTISSGSAATYDFDNLITMTGELKTGYNPMYGMNRKELAFMRKLQDGSGAYIWQAGNLGAGVPNQINGYPYIEIPDMPDQAANARPVIFADFFKMYTIVDSWQAIFLRNPYKRNGFVEFSIEGWVGGQVTLPEAGVLLKCEV